MLEKERTDRENKEEARRLQREQEQKKEREEREKEEERRRELRAQEETQYRKQREKDEEELRAKQAAAPSSTLKSMISQFLTSQKELQQEQQKKEQQREQERKQREQERKQKEQQREQEQKKKDQEIQELRQQMSNMAMMFNSMQRGSIPMTNDMILEEQSTQISTMTNSASFVSVTNNKISGSTDTTMTDSQFHQKNSSSPAQITRGIAPGNTSHCNRSSEDNQDNLSSTSDNSNSGDDSKSAIKELRNNRNEKKRGMKRYSNSISKEDDSIVNQQHNLFETNKIKKGTKASDNIAVNNKDIAESSIAYSNGLGDYSEVENSKISGSTITIVTDSQSNQKNSSLLAQVALDRESNDTTLSKQPSEDSQVNLSSTTDTSNSVFDSALPLEELRNDQKELNRGMKRYSTRISKEDDNIDDNHKNKFFDDNKIVNRTKNSDETAVTNQDIAESSMASSQDSTDSSDGDFIMENDGNDEIGHDNENDDDNTDEDMISADKFNSTQDEVKNEIEDLQLPMVIPEGYSPSAPMASFDAFNCSQSSDNENPGPPSEQQ